MLIMYDAYTLLLFFKAEAHQPQCAMHVYMDTPCYGICLQIWPKIGLKLFLHSALW